MSIDKMTKYVCWNDPLWTKDNPVCSAIAMALPEDCIQSWKKAHTDIQYSDEDALGDFMAVNWAWFIYLEDQGLKPWERTIDNLKN